MKLLWANFRSKKYENPYLDILFEVVSLTLGTLRIRDQEDFNEIKNKVQNINAVSVAFACS